MPALLTDTPQEGCDLAVKRARVVIKMTPADPDVRKDLRSVHEKDAEGPIAVSQVVATHFQKLAAANNYVREK